MMKKIKSTAQYMKFSFIIVLLLCTAIPLHAKSLVITPLSVCTNGPSENLRQGLTNMLVSRLAGKDLVILDETHVPSGNNTACITSEEAAATLVQTIGADYCLFGSITALGGVYSLDLRLMEVDNGKRILTQFSKVTEEKDLIREWSNLAFAVKRNITRDDSAVNLNTEKAAVPPSVTTEPNTPAVQSRSAQSALLLPSLSGTIEKNLGKPHPTGTLALHMDAMSFDMGDLDGDGIDEMVVLNQDRLDVYRKTSEGYVKKGTLKAAFSEEYLKISVGDLDGNGSDELYVVGLYGKRARTDIYTWQNTFKLLAMERGHYRTVRGSTGNTAETLLFQDSQIDHLYMGGIYVVDFSGTKPLNKRALPRMKGAQFYTVTPLTLDDGSSGYLALNEDDYLCLWDHQGALLWKDQDKVGGTENAVRVGPVEQPLDLPHRYPLSCRIVTNDVDANGVQEILVVHNIPLIGYLSNLKFYQKANIISYRIDKDQLATTWKSEDIDFSITDIQVRQGVLFLSANPPETASIGSREKGHILWFD